MDTIGIENFIVSGIHGLTAKEKRRHQRFRVNVAIKIPSHRNRTDDIRNTFDYRTAKQIITETIQETSVHLLETLAEDIAQKILAYPRVHSVEVAIQKPDIWETGVPGVKIRRQKIPSHINLLDFNIEEIIEKLSAYSGVSFPILPEGRRIDLLQEAQTYCYQQQPEIVGKGLVQEQLSSVTHIPQSSLFWSLRNDFLELLIRKCAWQEIQNIFAVPLTFNKLSLQKYGAGSIGITPHIDGKTNMNLICIFILSGTSAFAVCRDRIGTDPVFLDTTPGNVIMLRAPGFFNSTFQPFHFVSDVTEERIVFGLRQTTVSQ